MQAKGTQLFLREKDCAFNNYKGISLGKEAQVMERYPTAS